MKFQNVPMSPNLSTFVVPFMRERMRTNLSIRLNPETIENASALSVARFVTCITYAFALLTLRGALLWWYSDTTWQRILLLLSGTGHFLLLMAQESTILTYSCEYKSVYTWGSDPRRCNCPSVKRPCHSEADRRQFRSRVRSFLGYNYLAVLILWITEILWPVPAYALRKIGEKGWFSGSIPDLGNDPFHTFCWPTETYFRDENVYTIVFSFNEDNDAAPASSLGQLTFNRVPLEMIERMNLNSGATTLEKIMFAPFGICSAIFTIFAPIIFCISHPKPISQWYLFIEQILIALSKYYDFSDQTINTKLDGAYPCDYVVWNIGNGCRQRHVWILKSF